MGMLRSAGAARPAAELCREIVAQYPEAAWAHVQLGLMLLEQGDADGAIPALQVSPAAVLDYSAFTASISQVPSFQMYCITQIGKTFVHPKITVQNTG